MTEAEYEREHLKNLKSYQNEVEQEYLATITDIFQYVALYRYAQKVFKLDDYPILKRQIEDRLGTFRNRIYNIIKEGIEKEFKLSDTKNVDVLVEKIGERVRAELPPTSNTTIQEFTERRIRRLTLSDRVWKLHGQFYDEIQMNLYAGIGEGKSANKMAAEMKQFLKEPDKLFRRVRDAKGRLVLSQNARKYKPGQGVYRSSFRNALRMTATETNAAYRTADISRWKNSTFILGYDVKLSRNHKTYDICDVLQGRYPVTFVWQHWHPNCICHCVPVLPTPEQYNEYQDAILNGTADKFKFSNKVKDVPNQFKVYVAENREKMEGWARLPDWLTQNKRFDK